MSLEEQYINLIERLLLTTTKYVVALREGKENLTSTALVGVRCEEYISAQMALDKFVYDLIGSLNIDLDKVAAIYRDDDNKWLIHFIGESEGFYIDEKHVERLIREWEER